MEFLLEFTLGVLIILLILSLYHLKNFYLNAESLKTQAFSYREQLTQIQESSQQREKHLHEAISRLEINLSSERTSRRHKEEASTLHEITLRQALKESENNLQLETESRKKVLSQKKSSEVRLGNIAEKLAPFLDQFDFDPENCIFLGQPIDYVSFDDDIVTFIEVKSGKSQLTTKQRHIRDLIKSKQVAWKEIRIN